MQSCIGEAAKRIATHSQNTIATIIVPSFFTRSIRQFSAAFKAMATPSDFQRPLVLSGPSGTGKSTLLNRLFKEHPDRFGFSVSHTTRAPRRGEEDGVAYHFVSREAFEALIAKGAFIEHAQYSSNFYGTTIAAVEDVAKLGRRCILDIDSQGVRSLKKTSLKPFYLFISPPSISTLSARLRGRGTETEELVRSRLQAAVNEISYAKEPGSYDAVLINDDLERAYKLLEKIALGESREGDVMPPLDD